MKDDSLGREQVILSWESSNPLGHLQIAVGAARAAGDSAPSDLPLVGGARRQRWEQLNLSQGLDTAGWERACINYRDRKHGWDVFVQDTIYIWYVSMSSSETVEN